jgi:hypothetical protein
VQRIRIIPFFVVLVVLAGMAVMSLLVPPTAHATVPMCNESIEADLAPGQADGPPGTTSILHRYSADQRSVEVRLPPRSTVTFDLFVEDRWTGARTSWECSGVNPESDYVVQGARIPDDQPHLIIIGVSLFHVVHDRHDEF